MNNYYSAIIRSLLVQNLNNKLSKYSTMQKCFCNKCIKIILLLRISPYFIYLVKRCINFFANMIRLTCFELTTLILMLKLFFSAAIAYIISVMKLGIFSNYLITWVKKFWNRELINALQKLPGIVLKICRQLIEIYSYKFIYKFR